MTIQTFFESEGQFCASHLWEVIVATISVLTLVLSMSLVAPEPFSQFNDQCQNLQDVKGLDVVVLTLIRCVAVLYIYLQFCNLRRLGSKYLLGLANVFTISASFLFSLSIVSLIGRNLTGLSEVMPFFLLLLDLNKWLVLAKFALNSNNQDELVVNIGEGLSLLGPKIALDTFVETLVIGIGTLSGVKTIAAMCLFGCLTVVTNFIALVTIYPACLALVFELKNTVQKNRSILNVGNMKKSGEENQSNPVAQRVKIIMCIGLMVFHAHSRMATGNSETRLTVTESIKEPQSNLPLWQFYFEKLFSPGIDFHISSVLGIVLLVKYLIFDGHLDKEAQDNLITASKENAESIVLSPENQTCCSKSTESIDNYENLSADSKVDSTTVDRGKNEENAPLFSNFYANTENRSVRFVIADSFNDKNDTDIYKEEKQVQTLSVSTQTSVEHLSKPRDTKPSRSYEECVATINSDDGPAQLNDAEIIMLIKNKCIPIRTIESVLGDHERGVKIRRQILMSSIKDSQALNNLPYVNYDYSFVGGACCENVVGYMPVPVGVAGPLFLDGEQYHVPMATTEGCLVASTNRGCRALSLSGGVKSTVIGNGMTRAPVVRFNSAVRASQVKAWLEVPDNYALVKEAFDSTSRFARLQKLHIVQAARNLYVRFVAVTGDAMGMNMLSKGAEKALNMLVEKFFPDMDVLSLSGNFCTDKKPSAVNWLEGRGKSVICEAIIPSSVIKTVLKTSVPSLVDLNINKNLVGSAMAGSIGGFNAHAANIVTAIFIATGQDPAQNVTSSNCMTFMEPTGENSEDLYISCTMPSIEVGTIGGGTVLPPQASCLQMLGVQGSMEEHPGDNSDSLARIVCGTVLAGELSLMAALAAGHLVRSHLRHNRSSVNVGSSSTLPAKLCNYEQKSKPEKAAIPATLSSSQTIRLTSENHSTTRTDDNVTLPCPIN